MSEVEDKPKVEQVEETKEVDLQTTKELSKKRTVSPKKTNQDHTNNSENDSEVDSKNSEKVIKVGIKNIMLAAKFKDEQKSEIKKNLEQLPNIGTSRAYMYSLDGVIELFQLTDSQQKKLRTLATTRPTKLTSQEKREKYVTYDTKEKALNANQAKIDALLEANKALKAELRVLKRELKL